MEVAWGISGSLVGACVALVIALILQSRNGKPHHNPPDPSAVKAGDMATFYWQEQFRNIIRDELRVFRLEFMEALNERLAKED